MNPGGKNALSQRASSVQSEKTMVDSSNGRAMVDPLEGLPEKVQTIEQKLDALATSVDERFNAVEARFDAADARFNAVDARFNTVDERFDEVTSAFVEQRRYTEFAFQTPRDEMNIGFSRLERKLDVVIEPLIDREPDSNPPHTIG